MDISQLLKSLNDQRVQYVIIGATAFPTHGYARATADIDILIKPTRENAQRTLQALAQIGIDGIHVFVASLDDFIKMKRAANRPKDREDLKVLRILKNRNVLDKCR